MGYTYADAHPPDAPRPYHPTNDGSGGRTTTTPTTPTTFTPIITRHRNTTPVPPPPPRTKDARVPRAEAWTLARRASEGAWAPRAEHFADGVAAGARAEKMRKKQAYQRDLELQIAEKARRKAAEKLAQQELDSGTLARRRASDPWRPVSRGRGAGRAHGVLVGPSGRVGCASPGYGDDRQSGQSVPSYGEPSIAYHGAVVPESRLVPEAPSSPADARACPATAASRRRASEPQPLAGGPGGAAPVGSRGGAFARGHEDMHPAELGAKSRARATRLQPRRCARAIERARKEEGEGAARGRREAADQRRLAIEQERLREAFEREQAIERAKAEGRMRAEEEAFQAAAEKRRERKLVDMPEPRRAAAARRRGGGSVALSGAAFGSRARRPASGRGASPPPPRGPTPAGAALS